MKPYLRHVTVDDVKQIYEWANDESVRTNSFNSENIPYEEHVDWFYSKLESIQCHMYIMEYDSKPVGQVRLEVVDGEGVIGFSIDKNYRGNGFGELILKLLERKVIEDQIDLRFLVGYVKHSNKASNKIFSKLGYDSENQDDFMKYKYRVLCNKKDASTFKIGGAGIGEGMPVYIIAEMSANHGGSFERAMEIVRAAKDAGADCVKIQTYTPDTMTIDSDKKWFQINSGTWRGENLYSLYGKAYTPWEWQADIKREVERLGMDFLSTPFDKSSVDFLEELDVEFYKIASFEVTDLPLLKYIASKNKPIIMSTGNASLGELEEAVSTIKAMGNDKICLLKCSSAYPAIPADMNLKTMTELSEIFGVPTGLSDHSMGSVAAITSVALGARVLEKHFCISREIETPDSSFSMEPDEFKDMVDNIRQAERALGSVSFKLSEKERENKKFRRSIFVVKDIEAGELYDESNIRVIRPAYGLAPKYYDEVIGKKATVAIERGTPLKWSMVETEDN